MVEDEAKKWTLAHMDELVDRDLASFAARYKELYEFASSWDGLRIGFSEAEAWALENALQECLSLPSYQIKISVSSKSGRLQKLLKSFRMK